MHRDMNQNTRRSFLKAGTAAASATFAAPLLAAGEGGDTSALSLDLSLRKILDSYGSTRSVSQKGRTAHVDIKVEKFSWYLKSYEQLARISECVRVEQEKVTVLHGGTTYHITNRV